MDQKPLADRPLIEILETVMSRPTTKREHHGIELVGYDCGEPHKLVILLG